MGYDPVFKYTADRRSRKQGLHSDEAQHQAMGTEVPIKHENSRSPSMDTATLSGKSSPMLTSNLSNCSDSGPVVDKMNISSLLDAAAHVEVPTADVKKKRSFEDMSDKLTDLHEHSVSTSVGSMSSIAKKIKYDGYADPVEQTECKTWEQVETNFVNYIAGYFNTLLGTDRFSNMTLIGLSKICGLPSDGYGTVVIPSNSGTTTRPDGSVNNTSMVGQHIATLETIRQLVATLCPQFELDNLSIDEGSVGKLEELRISNEYKLLRATLQLLTSHHPVEFLPVSEQDQPLLARLKTLHHLLVDSSRTAQSQSQSQSPSQLQIQQQFDTSGVKSEDLSEARKEMMGGIGRIFAHGLATSSTQELWDLLSYISDSRQLFRDMIPRIPRLSSAQETEFLKYVSDEISSTHEMYVPLLIGAQSYVSRHELTGNGYKDKLVGMCTEGPSNVVLRCMVSIMMSN